MMNEPIKHPWQRVLDGAARAVRIGKMPHGLEEHRGQVIFPGAFNPLHAAHQRMAELAGDWFERPVEFELSIVNVEKPALQAEEIARRLQQFGRHQIVWVTRTPTFKEKARQFPGATFVVGLDTLQRIVDPAYYAHGDRGRDAALELICQRDCRFVVFGRRLERQFRTAEHLELPPELARRCRSVAAEEFHIDISSTELRRRL